MDHSQWQNRTNKHHHKNKCDICGKSKDGFDLCKMCRQDEEIKRMEVEANNPAFDGDDLEVRKQRLMQAKFHAHRAVELYFRGLAISSEALYGDIEKLRKAA